MSENSMDFSENLTPGTDLRVDLKADFLKGRRLVFCVGGGIAAIVAPKVIRELRRFGATVSVFASENALHFVGQQALEWASANTIVIKASGLAEHICSADGVVVFPATANIVAKAAHGLASDPVSSLIQSAMGQKIPILFCPTMHESLSQSPAFQENKQKLISYHLGIEFLNPLKEEGKDKASDPEVIALEAANLINSKPPQNIVVTSGGTCSLIDDVRFVGNFSSGELGSKLVQTLYGNGFAVTHIVGMIKKDPLLLSKVNLVSCPTFQEMESFFRSQNTKVRGFFHLAAVSDFLLAKQRLGKISSQEDSLTLEMIKSPKLIESPFFTNSDYKLACKLTSGASDTDLKIAENMAKSRKLDAILWNQAQVLVSPKHDAILLSKSVAGQWHKLQLEGKTQIAKEIVKVFMTHLKDLDHE